MTTYQEQLLPITELDHIPAAPEQTPQREHTAQQLGEVICGQTVLFHTPSAMKRQANAYRQFGVSAVSNAAATPRINTSLNPLTAFNRVSDPANID